LKEHVYFNLAFDEFLKRWGANLTRTTGSTFTHLECSGCRRIFDAGQIHSYCPDCQQPLTAGYDMEKARASLDRDEISRRRRGMWRWFELLPVFDVENVVSLGEGDTPLLNCPRLGQQLGLKHLFIKDESLNPTGSFKARGMAAAVSKAKELGIDRFVLPTAGNAGGALAAYASRAGITCHITAPEDTPDANIQESRIMGAQVSLVKGDISDAARLAGELAQREGFFDLSTFKEPNRLEGKKVMGFELAEAFGWDLPDAIVYPTGGGTGLVGIWKAIQEMRSLGWIEAKRQPRMIAVQAAGCAPVVRAFEQGAEDCEFWKGAETIAAGLRVPRSFASRLILRVIRESRGSAVAVPDAAILAAQRRIAQTEGIFAAPEGAATLAGLMQLLEQGWIDADERVVLLNTASGLKYLDPLPAG
jgi:threonine synthase